MGADQPIQGESLRIATRQPEIGPAVQTAVQSGFEDFGAVKTAMTDNSANTGLHSIQLIAESGKVAEPAPDRPPETAPERPPVTPPERPPETPPEGPSNPPRPSPPSLLEQLEQWKPPPGFPYGPGCPPPEPPPCC